MKHPLGLVLSGGGARGLGHVGVLRALSEEGVEPDVLSGTSAGAIVAALYAAGYSSDEMLEFFVQKNPFQLSKLALLGKPGIFDTEKVVADFLEYFPDNSFEALGKPVFLAATDLVEGRLEILCSGPLIPAILASASTPLLFTPTEIDGHWYSDGGITNNFLVEPLLGLCEAILGVYASPLRRIDGKDLTSSLAVSQRALEVGMFHKSELKFELCDLVLCPEKMSHFGNFDTKHLPDILEVGYRAARERMPEILDLVNPRSG